MPVDNSSDGEVNEGGDRVEEECVGAIPRFYIPPGRRVLLRRSDAPVTRSRRMVGYHLRGPEGCARRVRVRRVRDAVGGRSGIMIRVGDYDVGMLCDDGVLRLFGGIDNGDSSGITLSPRTTRMRVEDRDGRMLEHGGENA